MSITANNNSSAAFAEPRFPPAILPVHATVRESGDRNHQRDSESPLPLNHCGKGVELARLVLHLVCSGLVIGLLLNLLMVLVVVLTAQLG